MLKSVTELFKLNSQKFPVLFCPLNLSACRRFQFDTRTIPDIEEEGKESPKRKHWLTYNDVIFPPQAPDENRRPAYVCHVREHIKYSPKKMWYIACFVRGMSIDEAIKQLSFVPRKGAVVAKETLLEAQELAVNNNYVEYKSDLWVAESFVGKGMYIKGMRRHARRRIGKVEYKFCHYFVRLEEGKPPENYYNRPSFDRDTLIKKWLQKMRDRRVIGSL